ncbi:MAG: EAL domain-containing protein [Gammaproteobacteria bacterium]|nr:MAG: EAL domain-containing protein [Gammaproteobacteria bacterium]
MDTSSLHTYPDVHRPTRLILAGLGTAVLYVLSAKLGLEFAVAHDNVTAVWPPSGIALAALLIFGLRLWPAILVSEFIVDTIAGVPVMQSLGIAVGSTLAALAGAFMVRKLARIGNPLDSVRGVLVLVGGGGMVATIISATIGTSALLNAGLATRPDSSAIWFTWWLGDTGGVLIITPLLLAWKNLPLPSWPVLRVLEAVLLLTCTLLVALLIFGHHSGHVHNHYPLAFLPLIPLVWAAMRFGKHGATVCLGLIAASAIWGTIEGNGPLVHGDMNESLLLLQMFMGVAALFTLLLTASIHEHRQARRLIKRHNEEKTNSLGEILENSLNEIYMFDTQSLRFLNINQSARDNLGYTMDELHDMTPLDIKSEYTHESFGNLIGPLLDGTKQRLKFETMHRRKDGSRYPVEVNLHLSSHGNRQVFVAIILDITERYATQKQLNHMAHHDALTNLPNRVLFSDRLEHALQHHQRAGRQLALMFLDLDGFKKINDTLGHPAGDALLNQVAQRLLISARKGDTVARLGGDEFTMILEDLEKPGNVPEVARRILDSLARPFNVSGREVFLSASIGISMHPQDGDDVTALMKHADVAMFEAKKDGGNRYQFYLAEMTIAANKRLAMETDLRHALERDEFAVHFQPQVSLETNRIVGLEALLRWQHPQQGMVPPNVFIPIAEEAGLIEPIGEWVLRAACAQMRAWQDTTGLGIPVAVNLSGHQINDRLGGLVSHVLATSGLEPRYLELEITESCIMCQTDATIEYLRELRMLGVQLSIDDFGTGYSSMSYLKQLPIDRLKIDLSFVRDIPEENNDAAIIKAIIALGHTLDLTVIAEGVETAEQRAFLAENGCDVMQGYLFSPPRPAEEIGKLLSAKPVLSLVK